MIEAAVAQTRFKALNAWHNAKSSVQMDKELSSERMSTFCKASSAASGCAEDRGAATADYHSLGVAEDCCAAQSKFTD